VQSEKQTSRFAVGYDVGHKVRFFKLTCPINL
jgi:hypothetical protein